MAVVVADTALAWDHSGGAWAPVTPWVAACAEGASLLAVDLAAALVASAVDPSAAAVPQARGKQCILI